MSEAPQQQTLVFSGRLAPGMKRIRHEWSPGVREWLEGQVRGYRSDPTSQEIVRPTAMELAKLGVDLFGEMHGLAAREGMEMLAQRIREFKAHRRLGPLQLKYGRKKVFKRKSKLKAKAITPKAEAAKPVAGPVAVSADALCLEVQAPDGEWRTYRAASGGQRRRVDVALVFALAEISQAAYGRTAGTLWIDECFDSLDEDGTAEVIAVLQELAQDRAVVVITHNASIIERLPAQMHLRVDAGRVAAS